MTDIAKVFFIALALALALTPVVRALCIRAGMVDRPGGRRINVAPIPRGGGVAIVLALVVCIFVSRMLGLDFSAGHGGARFFRMIALAVAMSAIGLVDDKRGLNPKLKLAGQLAVAVAAWWWAGLGFRAIFPSLPAVLDFGITVFWIVGAVNAFNLIDGLDGLASGIALIASLAMAGALWFSGCGGIGQFLLHFAFAGALLGFLRYNYNPASVFLGDTGSMFIGFVVSALPLMFNSPNSFLVSVGVPLLAMGVPVFDTVLAILRRSLRHLLKLRDGGDGTNDRVMSPDSDHLHHRIFRVEGFNQRKVAWMLYAATAAAVGFGFVAMALKSRSAGLWLVAVACAAAVVFRSLSHVELFDAGRLLDEVAHDSSTLVRRRVARLSVPLYVIFDVATMVGVFFVLSAAFRAIGGGIPERRLWQMCLVRSAVCFAVLAASRVYVTIWSRAMASNFSSLFSACALGSIISGAVVFFAFELDGEITVAYTAAYALSIFFMLSLLRVIRPAVRDLFYSISCARLKGRKDVSRVLVYGSGLRYRAFRRELVRSAAANTRIIVGLLDDDLLLKGHYIGSLKVLGGINDAPEIINAVNADAVVIACEIEDEWKKVVMDILRPTNVKVTHFSFSETDL